MASIKDKTAALRAQLGLPEGNLKVIVDEAIEQLGLVDEVAGLSLADKVDLCLSTLGVAPEEISASGKAAGKAPATPIVAEAVTMGAKISGIPNRNAAWNPMRLKYRLRCSGPCRRIARAPNTTISRV